MAKIVPDAMEQTWREFAKDALLPIEVYPDDTQWKDMKLAFFAGAYCFLTMVRTMFEAGVDGDTGKQQMSAIAQELDQFYERLMETGEE
jgi:hypothetical protein